MVGIRLFRPSGLRRSVGLLRLENGAVLFEEFKREDEQEEIPASSVKHPSCKSRRALLPHTLMLPNHERAPRIGDLFSGPKTQNVRATPDRPRGVTSLENVVLGVLRERELRGES